MKQVWRVLPEQFIRRLQTIVPKDAYQRVLDSLSIERPTTLRVNTLQATVEEVRRYCSKQAIQIEPVPWCPIAFVVRETPLRVITDGDGYKKGWFYIQSLSSMIPPLVLDPKPGETVLDLCAAPGSKTTQMAALMQNTGKIIATDNSRIRLYKLEANLTMQGVINTTVQFVSGQSVWQTYPEYFDKVLVDVPCSMEGRITTKDPKSYEHWSPGKIRELAGRQKWLLRSAISATKPGGTIVYSTCTLAPEENEAIIDWILRKEKDAVVVEVIQRDHLSWHDGLTQWNTKSYHPDVRKAMRIFPNEEMEGFFVAKLMKKKSTVSSSQSRFAPTA